MSDKPAMSAEERAHFIASSTEVTIYGWRLIVSEIRAAERAAHQRGFQEARETWLIYVALLTDELIRVGAIADIHGFATSEARIEMGKRCRERCGITEKEVQAAIAALKPEEQ